MHSSMRVRIMTVSANWPGRLKAAPARAMMSLCSGERLQSACSRPSRACLSLLVCELRGAFESEAMVGGEGEGES